VGGADPGARPRSLAGRRPARAAGGAGADRSERPDSGLHRRTLRLKDHVAADPAAERLARNLLAHVAGAGEIGGDGLLARVRRGKGVAIFCRFYPAGLDADTIAYQRLTRWRMVRTIAQLANNLGAAMETDGSFFAPVDPVADDITLALPAATAPGQHVDPGLRPEVEALLAATVDDSAWASEAVPGGIAIFTDADGEAVLRRTGALRRSRSGAAPALDRAGQASGLVPSRLPRGPCAR